jgi:hypothetical protein
MRRLLAPATAGINAARHVVRYLTYQMSGPRQDR